jgi:hypothetical protein
MPFTDTVGYCISEYLLVMNLVAQENGPKKAPTASRFLKVHPEFLV